METQIALEILTKVDEIESKIRLIENFPNPVNNSDVVQVNLAVGKDYDSDYVSVERLLADHLRRYWTETKEQIIEDLTIERRNYLLSDETTRSVANILSPYRLKSWAEG